MEIQCPQCQSKFNLPDAAARPNMKLRCSVCKNIFAHQGAVPSAPPASSAPVESSSAGGGENLDDFSIDDTSSKGDGAKKSKGKAGKIIISLLVLLICIGGGGGVWWYMFKQPQKPAPTQAEIAKSVELMTMRNVRQYYVKNEKIGDIFVVEGKVVNEFPEPKELIEVEAAIYAPNKSTLMSKKQLAGTALSLFQLQVLGEEELESFLHNEIEILTKNTNVPKGGEVPFMLLFYNPPPEVAEFGVKVLSAKDVKKEE